MSKHNSKRVVQKEEIMHLLMFMLDTAAHGLPFSKKFEQQYQNRLGFQRLTDWKRYRGSVDLLVDTEYAICSAFEYQLGDLSRKHKDTGELYIRLYGILNAVYLQMGAFETIANLLNLPGRELVSKRFQSLKIYKLRGMAASHTVDYLYDNDDLKVNPSLSKRTSFRIIQRELDAKGNHIRVQDEGDNSTTFNLLQELTEYENVARNLLIKLIQHSVKTRYPNIEHRNRIQSMLDEKLPLMIDYSTVDRNKAYLEKEEKKRGKLIGSIDLSTLEDIKTLFQGFDEDSVS